MDGTLKVYLEMQKNWSFLNSANLWFVVCFNEAWISIITNKTINSNKFILLLNQLNSWLKSINNFGYDEMLLIIDNWSYRKSLCTKYWLIKYSFKVIYLPSNTPQWTPLENGFRLIKAI